MVRPGQWIRWFYPRVLWRGDKKERSVYLTFDDGPIPEVTPWVMEVLKQHHIRATFFCVGENVDKYSNVYQQVLNQGHQVGNHTYHHINTWSHSKRKYFESIEQAKIHINSNLFRPPHGKIYPWNVRRLKKQFDEVVMWDVLSCDYDRRLTSDKVYRNVIDNVRNGSIIVFHDSLKAWPHLKVVLPKVIEWLIMNNYQFKLIGK